MRIALLTIGSRGDVQPFIALGVGLRARGHDVILGAPEGLKHLVERAGLTYRPTPGDPDGFFTMPEVVDSLRRSPYLRDLLKALPAVPEEYDQQVVDEIAAAGQGADAVVYAPLTIAAAYGRSDVPWAAANWWPNTRTWRFPAVESGQRRLGPLSPLYHLFTHARAAREEWAWRRPEVDGYRRRQGLEPFGGRSPFLRLGRERPYLYPFSPSVLPKPRDWPARAHVTGYWFWDQDWQPTRELVDFLADGPAPVAADVRQHLAVHRREQVLEYAIAAARAAGRRIVVVDGPDVPPSDDVLRLHDVDYRWLFPRTAAVVHHGGFGTTAEVVRAGRPHVVVPVFADHPFWARRLTEIGVAAPAVDFRTLTREALVASTVKAVREDSLGARAARLGEAVRRERGVENACQVVESWIDNSSRTLTG
uniref:Glycosyltransferase n=1 Tax=Micromonospora griseorubida TaxID=28040 RepID=Q83WF1_MICGR|nr:glycosyltransferase [Micromonospora griseorubida]